MWQEDWIHWTIRRKELRHFQSNILFRHGFSGCGKKSYGEEVTRTMAADFLKERPVCCQNKVTPEQLKKELEQEGVTVQEHPYLPYAFFISGYDYLESLDCFWKGWFTVQDVSSMLVAELAAPEAGNKIVDICAAPGGKSLYCGESYG